MDKEVMRGEWLKRWRDAVGTLNAKEILHERRGGGYYESRYGKRKNEIPGIRQTVRNEKEERRDTINRICYWVRTE